MNQDDSDVDGDYQPDNAELSDEDMITDREDKEEDENDMDGELMDAYMENNQDPQPDIIPAPAQVRRGMYMYLFYIALKFGIKCKWD